MWEPHSVSGRLKWGARASAALPSHNCLCGIWIPSADLPTSLHHFRWTSHRQCWVSRHLSSQVPTKLKHHLPPCIQLWRVLVKWLTAPAWLPSFKSSYLRWCWTLPAQPQGTAPQGDQYQWPRLSHWPSDWRTSLGQAGQFWPCPSQ